MKFFKSVFAVSMIILSGTLVTANTKDFKEYTIKKGKHHSNRPLKLFVDKSPSFQVIFDSTCVYKTSNPQNQGDINKLFGFSDCSSLHHHENSARFGWRWFQGKMQIFAYVYKNSEIEKTHLADIALNEPYSMEIKIIDNVYHFKLEGKGVQKTFTTTRISTCRLGLNYQLWPYFGGDETSPKDIIIQMKKQ